ncbi:MAG: hypothetical protein EOR73_32495 [Mesorhizobium sp.]|nr:MAG: hypothetical protein EOR73_32495 [Mesorhizobium sp.]
MKWARRAASARDRPSVPAGVIPPLLPTLVDRVPQGPTWLHEIKWDGYRIGVYLDRGKVKILTRNLHDWTVRFPTIVSAVAELAATDAIIDGEAFVADDKACRTFPVFSGLLAAAGDVRTSCLPSSTCSRSTARIFVIGHSSIGEKR